MIILLVCFSTAVPFSMTVSATDFDVTGNISLEERENRAPVATDDAYEINEGTTCEIAAPGVLENDGDQDGDVLDASLVDDPAHGVVELAADGAFVYTPEDGWNGTDQFTYTASDGSLVSEPATVTLTIINTDERSGDAGDENSAPRLYGMWTQDLSGAMEDGDPDHLSNGAQYLPPCAFGAVKTVNIMVIWSGAESGSGEDVVSAEVYLPNGEILAETQIEPFTDGSATGIFDRAFAAGLLSSGSGKEELRAALAEGSAVIGIGNVDLAYHQVPGDYLVRVSLAGAEQESSSSIEGTFGYLPAVYCEYDFESVDYGEIALNTPRIVTGDLSFGTSGAPTVRNVGNVPAIISIVQSDMGLGKSRSDQSPVSYSARLGSGGSEVYYTPDKEVTLPETLDVLQTESLDFTITVLNGEGKVHGQMVIDCKQA